MSGRRKNRSKTKKEGKSVRIPPETVEEIKYRNDIVSVVSAYVDLKPAGSNLVGLCPFHSEKTPSFTVFRSTGTCHCFGCGQGGDVVSFIRLIENVDYVEALELLAKRAGVTIPSDNTEVRSGGVSSKRILAMNKDAARIFNAALFLPEGKKGLDYYTQKRKFSPGLIKHFGLGYAPESFDYLYARLKKLGYTDEEMTKGFLCGTSKKTGKPYDMYRGRVIIPIIDTHGDVIAFGGRVLDDSLPKYINTQDTPAYKKGRNLFALNFARKDCADMLILCEGYMDAIALHGAGFTNAIATLGTATTPEQARLMARYTKSVVIAYDADEAGQKNAERAFRYIGEVGLDCRILKMTGAKDPDEYIKKFGRESFNRLISESRSHFDFRLEEISKQYDLKDPEARLKAISEAVDFIARRPSAVQRELYVSKAADYFSVSKDSVKIDADKKRDALIRDFKKEAARKNVLESQGIGDRINPDYAKNVRAAMAEESVLGILLTYPELMKKAAEEMLGLTEESFFTEFGKKVYSEAVRIARESDSFDPGLLGESFTAEEMSRINSYTVKRNGLRSNVDKELADCIAVLNEEAGKEENDLASLLEKKRRQNKKN